MGPARSLRWSRYGLDSAQRYLGPGSLFFLQMPHFMTRATFSAASLLVLMLVGLALVAPGAGAETPTAGTVYRDGPSGRYLVGGTWYRRSDRADRGLRRGYQRQTSRRGWRAVTIPNAANATDNSTRSYVGGVWWYRKDFELPSSSTALQWILRFESVNNRATVWLNGRRLGAHTGGYLPFELATKGLLRRGSNRLVVRVDSRRRALDVPAGGARRGGRYVGGWWNYAGILREVYLRKVEGLDMVNVNVRPDLPDPDGAATVRVRAIVANYTPASADATLEGTVAGHRIAFTGAIVPARGFHIFRGSVKVENPKLWTPSQPNLYRLQLSLSNDGEEVQSYSQHTGIRSIRVDENGRVLLNGKTVFLRGASLHEDDPTTGAALSPAQIRNDVELLRQLGASMTRAHYPLHPLTLELADRYGILVWSEVPVYQMADSLFRRAAVRRQAVGMVRDMVNRDRSHPSVLVWSLGNENTSRPGTGFTRYIRSAARVARQLDPTRLVGLAFPGYPTVGKQQLYTELDALGVNDYFGWYTGPQNSIADRSGLSAYLERLHDDYRSQALFVTEFGAEAARQGPVTEKGTFAFQQDFLAYHMSVFAQKPYLNGALVWILRDFKVKPGYDGGNPVPTPPYNAKGLVDAGGTKKPSFDTARKLFAEAPR
jgi:beta-glucuronidase